MIAPSLTTVGLLLALLAPPAVANGCPSQLRIGVVDYELRPLVLAGGRGVAPQGRLIDWVRQAVSRSGCSPTLSFERMPIRRGRVELERGSIDIWAVALVDGSLHEQGALPMARGQSDAMLGFYRASYSLYVLTGETRVSWDGDILSGPAEFSVGIAPVQALAEVSRDKGWTVDRAPDTPGALAKLLSGRHLVAILPDPAIAAQLPEVTQKLRRLSPPVLTTWYHSPASKPFAAHYPDFMHSYWLELCRIGRAEQREGLPCREP
ncbi:hypothetical protein [Roseateles saccharophilus]|uniref:Polar amino acid transport system substrate-binding protein n=1 Tax=Roseateles saccharophilus TaxID=304 RepID=A0A4R3UNJ6_ROSSA|nr:hypothetical protein [Roseateles saccharophilus]MDG0833487.1 hypothetical protein [Roseateles saccharophilus]TCU92512.1 hypothetical protein EV671_102225 [Roseateles saccharophilus]